MANGLPCRVNLQPGVVLAPRVPDEIAADAAAIWARANAAGSDPQTFGRQVVEVFRAACAAAGCDVKKEGM